MSAYPVQASHNLSHVGAEDPPVGVELVDDDEPKLSKVGLPVGVVGEDAEMQHIGVRNEHRRRGGRDFSPTPAGGVAVVNGRRDGWVSRHRGDELLENLLLVLLQRFEGKEIERLGRLISEGRFQDREVIDEGFAAGRRGHDGHVLARSDGFEGLHLMGVEPLDAKARESGGKLVGKGLGGLAVAGRLGGNDLVMDHLVGVRLGGLQLVEKGGEHGLRAAWSGTGVRARNGS